MVTYTYFLIRVILKLKNGGDKEFEQLPNGQKRYFKDLISHHNEIKQDENKMFVFMAIYWYLQICLDDSELLLPKNELLEIFGKIFINRCERVKKSSQYYQISGITPINYFAFFLCHFTKFLLVHTKIK